MYERKNEPVLEKRVFVLRVLRLFGGVLPLVVCSLFLGMLGYKYLENMSWVDAFLNASMIMSGMGPATELHSDGGKIFASVYAIYSGLFLIAVTGYLMAPFFHRVMHKFHQDRS